MINLLIFCVVTSNAFEFWDPAEEHPTLNTYFGNAYIGSSFSQLDVMYPGLVQSSSLGETPNKNEIYEITITGDVSNWKTANKPSVKYVANMHGNEVRGRGLIMKLVYYLTAKYNSTTDPDVTKLLDTTIFHLIPTINPDGYDSADQSCSGVVGRYTSDGTDMNRDFPSHWFSGRKLKFAAETEMVMEYGKTVPAILGVSFHDGALVTNYPWDGYPNMNSGKYAASPDDAIFINMAKTYSENHKSMADPARSCSSDNFKDGITNGNEWYKVFNGMQDWNYFYNDCFELTIELGCCKYPYNAATTYSDVWSDNFDSILAYSKLANYGIRGRVTDYNGIPIPGVKIRVSSINKTIEVRHPEGYYWRPLLSGRYNVTAFKHGYYTYTRRNVSVLKEQSTEVSFILISKSQVRKLRKRKREA